MGWFQEAAREKGPPIAHRLCQHDAVRVRGEEAGLLDSPFAEGFPEMRGPALAARESPGE